MADLFFPRSHDDPQDVPRVMCKRADCLGNPTWVGTWADGKWAIDCDNVDCTIEQTLKET